MTWGRLDDSFYDHPKIDGLPLEAVGLWTLARSWALRHRYRRLGYVPDYVAAKFAPRGKAARLAGLLVQRGLWDEAPEGDGWDIHDFRQYLDPNDDGLTASEQQLARSEHARLAAQARWDRAGRPRKPKDAPKAARADAPAMPPDAPAMPEHVPEHSDEQCPSNASVPSRPDNYTTPTVSPLHAAPTAERHTVADSVLASWWDRHKHETAQSFIALRPIIRTAVKQLGAERVAQALERLAAEGVAVSGGAITNALRPAPNQRAPAHVANGDRILRDAFDRAQSRGETA